MARHVNVISYENGEIRECPLCMEPLELDDLKFYPCTCRYQICRFCWHRIRTSDTPLCPACRKVYSEDPASFTPLTDEDFANIKRERKQKEQAKKQRAAENRQHLASIRVVQKNLVFVVGLTKGLADPEVLKKPEYFGKFGRIAKVVINSSTAYAGAQIGPKGPSASAYITFFKPEDCLRAIQAVNYTYVDGRPIKCSLGTTKYCSTFLKGTFCHKLDCMYLHELGERDASFTKEEMQAGKHQEYEQKLCDYYLNPHSSRNKHKAKMAAQKQSESSKASGSKSAPAASKPPPPPPPSARKEAWPMLNQVAEAAAVDTPQQAQPKPGAKDKSGKDSPSGTTAKEKDKNGKEKSKDSKETDTDSQSSTPPPNKHRECDHSPQLSISSVPRTPTPDTALSQTPPEPPETTATVTTAQSATKQPSTTTTAKTTQSKQNKSQSKGQSQKEKAPGENTQLTSPTHDKNTESESTDIEQTLSVVQTVPSLASLSSAEIAQTEAQSIPVATSKPSAPPGLSAPADLPPPGLSTLLPFTTLHAPTDTALSSGLDAQVPLSSLGGGWAEPWKPVDAVAMPSHPDDELDFDPFTESRRGLAAIISSEIPDLNQRNPLGLLRVPIPGGSPLPHTVPSATHVIVTTSETVVVPPPPGLGGVQGPSPVFNGVPLSTQSTLPAGLSGPPRSSRMLGLMNLTPPPPTSTHTGFPLTSQPNPTHYGMYSGGDPAQIRQSYPPHPPTGTNQNSFPGFLPNGIKPESASFDFESLKAVLPHASIKLGPPPQASQPPQMSRLRAYMFHETAQSVNPHAQMNGHMNQAQQQQPGQLPMSWNGHTTNLSSSLPAQMSNNKSSVDDFTDPAIVSGILSSDYIQNRGHSASPPVSNGGMQQQPHWLRSIQQLTMDGGDNKQLPNVSHIPGMNMPQHSNGNIHSAFGQAPFNRGPPANSRMPFVQNPQTLPNSTQNGGWPNLHVQNQTPAGFPNLFRGQPQNPHMTTLES